MPATTILHADLTLYLPAATQVPRPFPLIKSAPYTDQREVWIFGENGRRTAFTENADGSFTTKDLERPQLQLDTTTGSRWILRSAHDGFRMFAMTGELQQQLWPDGKSLTYSRQGGTLSIRSSPSNRELTYSMDDVSGKLDHVTLPDGSQIRYAIDTYGAVHRVTYPDGSSRAYLYDETAYSGITTARDRFLTGLIDENGIRFATYTYNGIKPIATELAGGVGKYSFYWVDGSSGSTRVTFPPPGGQSIIGWDSGPDGERRLVTNSQPAGSGCAASTSSVAYDTAGNVASRTDFKYNKACYKYDLTRNLETARVEGLTSSTACPTDAAAYAIPTTLTADKPQIKVSTTWHPDWRLEAKRAEPKKLTTWVYNGQPDPSAGNAIAACAPGSALLPDGKPIAVLCKKIEQATTNTSGTLGFAASVTGTARTWTWTYNGYGQVLTENGPRTDVADTTTYTYYADTVFDAAGAGHTTGDLWKVTNAKGQVTETTLYDKHGHPLEIKDPNGMLTRLTWHVRGWLTGKSVGPATGTRQNTTYDYDAVGQLKRVTHPDGSILAYTYDDAHRLTDLSDALGNAIHYTLDAMGNRIKEEVKDPSGALVRSQRRVYDALNRVQNRITPAQ